jgi:phosphoglycolate phosphatase-like HAD superfamily hydrolase
MTTQVSCVKEVSFFQSYLPYIQPYQQVIFDFDDTLALTEIVKRQKIVGFFERAGYDANEVANHLQNYNRAELVTLYYPGTDIDSEVILAELNRSLELAYAEVTIPQHHLAVFDLNNASILSAGRQNEIEACLKANHVGGKLPVYISSGKDKTASLEKLITSSDVLFVGDSQQDETSAKNLGIDFLRVTT